MIDVATKVFANRLNLPDAVRGHEPTVLCLILSPSDSDWQEGRSNFVRRQFSEPGKPIQNAFIESFTSRLREGVPQPAGVPLAR